jgi:hypothetical protein
LWLENRDFGQNSYSGIVAKLQNWFGTADFCASMRKSPQARVFRGQKSAIVVVAVVSIEQARRVV